MVGEKACVVVFGVKLGGASASALAKELDAQARLVGQESGDDGESESDAGMENFVIRATGSSSCFDTDWRGVRPGQDYLVGFAIGEEGLGEGFDPVAGFDPDSLDPCEIFAELFEREVRPKLAELGIQVGEPRALRSPIRPC